MTAFAELLTQLLATTRSAARRTLVRDYLAQATPADAAWAVHVLGGGKLKRIIGPALLERWLAEALPYPAWLVSECVAVAGDLADAVTLLHRGFSGSDHEPRATVGPAPTVAQPGHGPRDAAPPTAPPGHAASPQAASPGAPPERPAEPALDDHLAFWIEQRLKPLAGLEREAQQTQLRAWWAALSAREAGLRGKLLPGSLRVGVSRLQVAAAVSELAGLPREAVLERLAGDWQPSAEAWASLTAPENATERALRPYPFFLAHPAPDVIAELGSAAAFHVEWKWDGIRAQAVLREGQVALWSRGEEDVTARFPEVVEALAARAAGEGMVLDGELIGWRDGPLPFAELQRRIGRKTVGAKLRKDVPVTFIAYDLLEQHGVDLRALPLAERRARLTETLANGAAALVADPAAPATGTPALLLSAGVAEADWEALARRRETARSLGVEGFMLKPRDGGYSSGRRRGGWWKWKVDPYTFDAVLMHAQAGSGRRATLLTDYTFGVWSEGGLVPVAKAYSGLADEDIVALDRWVRANVVERHGPVWVVSPKQVFELACDQVQPSKRHKAGLAVRFPRMHRWRRDKAPADADTLATLRGLLPR